MKPIFTISLVLLISKVSFTQRLNYENNFDNIPNDTLLVFGTEENNIWQIGYSEKSYFSGEGRREPPSIITDIINPYPTNNTSSFEISFGNTFFELYHMFGIQFDHKYQTESGLDGGYVEISYDNGNSWTNIIEDTLISKYGTGTYCTNLYSISDTLFNGVPGYSGDSNDWRISGLGWFWDEIFYSWLGEDGITPKIRFVFQSDSIENNLAGWIIDHILLFYGPAESVTEISDYFESHIFPNPVVDEAVLLFENPMKCVFKLQIFNSTGALIKVLYTNSNQNSIYSGEFESGLYLYRLSTDDNSFYSRGKFIVE